MTKRERKARAAINRAEAIYDGESWGVPAVCAGLLAALRETESQRKRYSPMSAARQVAETIRNRILDAMERAKGGEL